MSNKKRIKNDYTGMPLFAGIVFIIALPLGIVLLERILQ